MICGHIDNVPDDLALLFRLRYKTDFPWIYYCIIPVKIFGIPYPDALIEYNGKTYTALLKDNGYLYRCDTLAVPSSASVFADLLYLDLEKNERDLLYTFTGTIEMVYEGNKTCKMTGYKVD